MSSWLAPKSGMRLRPVWRKAAAASSARRRRGQGHDHRPGRHQLETSVRVSSTVRWSMWRTGSGRSGSSSSIDLILVGHGDLDLDAGRPGRRLVGAREPLDQSLDLAEAEGQRQGHGADQAGRRPGRVDDRLGEDLADRPRPGHSRAGRSPARSGSPVRCRPSVPHRATPRPPRPASSSPVSTARAPALRSVREVEVRDLVGASGMAAARAELLQQAAGVRPQGRRHGDREEVDRQEQ